MASIRKIARGLRSLFRKQQVEQELSEEIAAFAEMAAQEKMKRGLSRQEALRAVRLESGTVEIAREEVRSATWESFVEDFWRDIRFSVRIEQISNGVFKPNAGSLFLAIQRLERDASIDAEWQPTENNRRAKYYSLTKKGRKKLNDETREWSRQVAAVARILEA
jgi:PadR family transcriptional regulator PadR